jgi:hypothetical protein
MGEFTNAWHAEVGRVKNASGICADMPAPAPQTPALKKASAFPYLTAGVAQLPTFCAL